MTGNNDEGKNTGSFVSPNGGRQKTSNRLNKIASHPLILVIIAAILSAWLIPWIHFKSERRRVLFEKRLDKAIDITKNHQEVTARLNALQSALEMFQKDNLVTNLSAARLEEEKNKLRERMNMLYLEFDNKAWFWYWNLIRNAKIVGVFKTGEIEYLKKQMLAYEDNLVKSLEPLRQFWIECLKAGYDPSNPMILKCMKQSRQMLHNTMLERNKIIDSVIDIICSSD